MLGPTRRWPGRTSMSLLRKQPTFIWHLCASQLVWTNHHMYEHHIIQTSSNIHICLLSVFWLLNWWTADISKLGQGHPKRRCPQSFKLGLDIWTLALSFGCSCNSLQVAHVTWALRKQCTSWLVWKNHNAILFLWYCYFLLVSCDDRCCRYICMLDIPRS